jgi:phage-related protein
MKPLIWLGDSRRSVQSFPAAAQDDLGYQLEGVQDGRQPADFKPMSSIGSGVEEIRVWVESGTYRVIYIAKMDEAVYVLHAFQKKSQQTSQSDIELARNRLKALLLHREQSKKNP